MDRLGGHLRVKSAWTLSLLFPPWSWNQNIVPLLIPGATQSEIFQRELDKKI